MAGNKQNQEKTGSTWQTFWKADAITNIVALIVVGAIIITAIIVYGN